MQQVTIRHCTLRLIRHGGWSWGQDPGRLLGFAARALPALVVEKLHNYLHDGGDLEIAVPLRLRVRLRLDDLLDAADHPPSSALTALIDDQITRQLERQGRIDAGPIDDVSIESDAGSHVQRKRSHMLIPHGDGSSVLGLLTTWHTSDVLPGLLVHFSLPALRHWEAAALTELNAFATMHPILASVIEDAMRAWQSRAPAGNDENAIRSMRLQAIAWLLAQPDLQCDAKVLTEVLKRVLPLPGSVRHTTGGIRGRGMEEAARLQVLPPESDSRPRSTSHGPNTEVHMPVVNAFEPLVEGEVSVGSVLPFLALGVVSALGCLKVLDAMLKSAGLLPQAPVFAQSFAYKLLAAPQRGWHRDPASERAAAAFAGLHRPLSSEHLYRFARQLNRDLSVLDAYLLHLLVTGHETGRAILLHRTGPDVSDPYVLMAVQGAFPLAWCDDIGDAVTTFNQFVPSVLLLEKSACTPEAVQLLMRQSCTFVTNALPGRDDVWRNLDRRREYWTNDLNSTNYVLQTQIRHMERAIHNAESITHELLQMRPALLPTPSPAYERALTLLASTVLGTLAWELWHEKESVDPGLALQRFSDLEGKVVFTPDRVIVKPALGKRLMDLRDGGFLKNIPQVSWLGNRGVEFTGL